MRSHLFALTVLVIALLLRSSAVIAAEPASEQSPEDLAFIEEMKQGRLDSEQQELKLEELAAKIAKLPYFQQRLAETAPKPTGDALFDRYCSEVWRLNATNAFMGAGLDEAAALPDELLAQWEGDFGADPRFWQLRYFCAEGSAGDAVDQLIDPNLKEQEAGAVYYLEEGLSRGAIDAALLQELFAKRLESITRRNRDLYDKSFIVRPEDVPELKPLTDLLTSQFPDEASSWYSQATVHFALGEQQAALADLKRSLDCPSRSALEVFPLSVALKGVIAGEAPGSEYICGMLLLHWGGYSHRLAALKRQCQPLVDAAAVSMDMRDVQLLHDVGFQMQHAPEYPSAAVWSGMMPSLSLCRNLLINSPERVSAEQRAQLLRLHDDIKSDCVSYGTWLSVSADELLEPPKLTGYMFPLFADLKEGEELQFMLPMLLAAALDRESFGKDFLDQDLGWGVFRASYDSAALNLTRNYEERMFYIKQLERWDWQSMSYIPSDMEVIEQAAAEAEAARQGGDG